MALERPPRSTPISQYAPPRVASTASSTRLRAPEPRRKSSATWVVRSTPGELPSLSDDDDSDGTMVGLGGELGLPPTSRGEDLAGVMAAARDEGDLVPTSRVPTRIPSAERFLEVLEAAMAL